MTSALEDAQKWNREHPDKAHEVADAHAQGQHDTVQSVICLDCLDPPIYTDEELDTFKAQANPDLVRRIAENNERFKSPGRQPPTSDPRHSDRGRPSDAVRRR